MKNYVYGISAVFIAAVLILSCSRANFIAYYDMELRDVQKPSSVTGVMDSVNTADEQEEAYEDSLLRMFWVPSARGIAMRIVNKSDTPVSVEWESAEFVDAGGVTHAVVHAGMPDSRQPSPSKIEAGGMFETILGPADKAVFQGGAVRFGPLFDTYEGSLEGQLRRSAKGYIGKNIQVVLPLRKGTESLRYINTFEIVDAGTVRQLDD